jgi:AcrR family transcriptional regulator
LADGGPDALSVREVADLAGVTTRAVYTVFGSKAGLIAALAARGYGILADGVAAVQETDDPAADLVAAGVDGFRPFAIGHPHLFRLTFERVDAAVLHQPTVGPEGLRSYEALVRWIVRAQRAGVIDGRPVGEVAFAFHALCQGLAGGELADQPAPLGARLWAHALERTIDPADRWRAALGALVQGMAPGPSPVDAA